MMATVSLNPFHVVHETIDAETILIHLGTGTYYSLDGAGSEIWQLLAAGASRETVMACARDRYLGDPVEVELEVAGLIDELLREELLVEGEARAVANPQRLPPGEVEFVTPVLHAYTDMQEFMLVDPLHDVDEVAGWPSIKRA